MIGDEGGVCRRLNPARIEEPRYPDGREPWLWNLAANQWTREEMADGTCWRGLTEAT